MLAQAPNSTHVWVGYENLGHSHCFDWFCSLWARRIAHRLHELLIGGTFEDRSGREPGDNDTENDQETHYGATLHCVFLLSKGSATDFGFQLSVFANKKSAAIGTSGGQWDGPVPPLACRPHSG